MALPMVLMLELALYCSCFLCGIITAATVTISQGNFAGRCMLYGSVQFNGSEVTVDSSSAVSLCYFVSAISVCVAVFCFSLTLFWIYSICMDGEVKRERLWMNFTLGLSGLFLFFLLVTGCILRIGRDKLCDSVLSAVTSIKRCAEAEGVPWSVPYSGSGFYSRLHSAEVAVWVNFFLWLFVVALVLLQRRQGGSEYRMGGEETGASPSETEPFLHRP